jgi:hypothetical protein
MLVPFVLLCLSNSERAQRLVQDSRAGLETYQRQVKALEERLETEGGKGGDNRSVVCPLLPAPSPSCISSNGLFLALLLNELC